MEKSDSRHVIRTLFWEIGAPVILYYGLHLLGVGDVTALAAAAGLSVGRTLRVAVQHRRLDGFSALVGIMFVIGLGLTLLTGDPRVALLKDSVLTGVTGVVFLGSCVVGRPMMFALAKKMLPETRHAEADRRWHDDPVYRRRLVVLSLIWGVILLTEALVRIVLVYALPVSVMVGVSHVLQLGAIGLAILCSIVYTRVARRQGRQARPRTDFA